jgi:hypothetical protein
MPLDTICQRIEHDAIKETPYINLTDVGALKCNGLFH